MGKKNTNVYQILIGIYFIARALYEVYYFYTWNILSEIDSFQWILGIAYLVMGLSLILNVPLLFPIGAGIQVLFYIYDLYGVSDSKYIYLILSDVGAIIAAILFLALSLVKSKAVVLGILSAIMFYISKILLVRDIFHKDIPSFVIILCGGIESIYTVGVPIVLLGYTFQYGSTGISISRVEKKNNTSRIEELSKLKELLDIGAIDREEFDTKKKQILGL